MKVFISWSGEKSLSVAKLLKEWIPCVIQNVQPYFSSDDIDKGARWSTDIAKELSEADFGILCVTKDNLASQWLNFEAGALSKAIDKSKVCPFLLDLKASDITESPILQFQMANTDKDDMFKLFKTINKHLSDEQLEEQRLEKLFNAFWPEIEKGLSEIKQIKTTTSKNMQTVQDREDILEEMLELLRSQQRILKDPEQIMPRNYLSEVFENSKSKDISYRFRRNFDIQEMRIREILSSDNVDEKIKELSNLIDEYFWSVRRALNMIR